MAKRARTKPRTSAPAAPVTTTRLPAVRCHMCPACLPIPPSSTASAVLTAHWNDRHLPPEAPR
jgi:hypothetical protein